MQDILLLVSLLGCAAVFIGFVMIIRGRRGEATTSGEDAMLRDGVILAVLIPIVGVFWSARLFAKERYGHGIAVLVMALAMMLVYFIVWVSSAST